MDDYIYIYIYMYIHTHTHGEMVDFSEPDKMIKINGKVDKSNTYMGLVVIFRSLFMEELLTTNFFSFSAF